MIYQIEDITKEYISLKKMATEPQSDGQTVEGEATTTGGFTPRGSDIVVAVMGVTGAGKSTFISKCVTDSATPAIGHDIESCRWLYSSCVSVLDAYRQ